MMQKPSNPSVSPQQRLLLLLILGLMAACTAPPEPREAQVERVFFDPTTQTVNVQGTYRSSCEQIADIVEAVEGTNATITLLVIEEPGADCADGAVPFTTAIPTALDLTRQGRHTITVNGVSTAVAVDANGEIVTSGGTLTPGLAAVDEVDLVMLTTVPVRVALDISGTLPDGCTAIRAIDQSRRGAAFSVEVETIRDETASCADEPLPFAESVELNVSGLPAGEYTVQIHDLTRTFTLVADNVDAANLAGCPNEAPDDILFGNAADGYCVQYPPEFLPATPRAGLLLLEPRDPGTTRISLTIERRGSAGDLSAANLADRAVIDLPVPAADIIRSTTTLGGVEAVVLDRIPGAVESRQAFLVHDGMTYVLSLLPVGEADPAATERALALWDVVTTSLHFIE